MKIFYDHQIFNLQKYGGISKYFLKLIENFSNSVDPSIISLFPLQIREVKLFLGLLQGKEDLEDLRKIRLMQLK